MDTVIMKYATKDVELDDVFGGVGRPRSLPICVFCLRAVRNISYRGEIGEYVCDPCWEVKNPEANN